MMYLGRNRVKVMFNLMRQGGRSGRWRVARVEEARAATSSMCLGSWEARRATSSIICNFDNTSVNAS